MASERILYSDLDFDFEKHPVTRDVTVKTNNNAVARAIRNLLLTKRYERFYRPEVGSGIYDFLFEPISPLTSANIRTILENMIKNFEPRVNLINVSVTESSSGNSLDISIEYSIFNIVPVQSITVTLNRVR